MVAKPHKNDLVMPKATANWLIENTSLTFHQIADFTDLDVVQIESLANEDVGFILDRDPIRFNELTREEIDRCQNDAKATLKRKKSSLPKVKTRAKGPRYTPVSKRADKPNAIAYILKNNPDISDAQICKLVGTTKPTIEKIRNRTHPNSSSLRAQHPAELGLCSYQEYEKALEKGLKAAGKDPALAKQSATVKNDEPNDEQSGNDEFSSFDFSNFLGTGNSNSSE